MQDNEEITQQPYIPPPGPLTTGYDNTSWEYGVGSLMFAIISSMVALMCCCWWALPFTIAGIALAEKVRHLVVHGLPPLTEWCHWDALGFNSYISYRGMPAENCSSVTVTYSHYFHWLGDTIPESTACWCIVILTWICWLKKIIIWLTVNSKKVTMTKTLLASTLLGSQSTTLRNLHVVWWCK